MEDMADMVVDTVVMVIPGTVVVDMDIVVVDMLDTTVAVTMDTAEWDMVDMDTILPHMVALDTAVGTEVIVLDLVVDTIIVVTSLLLEMVAPEASSQLHLSVGIETAPDKLPSKNPEEVSILATRGLQHRYDRDNKRKAKDQHRRDHPLNQLIRKRIRGQLNVE